MIDYHGRYHRAIYISNYKVAARILNMCYGFIYTKSQFMPVLSIIYCFIDRPADMCLAVGVLVCSSVLTISLTWHIATKQIKRMDKGEKLAGAVGILEGKLFLAMLSIIGVPAVLLFYGSSVAGGPLSIFSYAAFYGGLGGAFLGNSMRKREIYEKGIGLEVRFVEWENVVGHEGKTVDLRLCFVAYQKR